MHRKNIFKKIFFPKIFLTKYFFRKKIQNKFVNILELVLFYVLNTLEHLVIFRELKIGAAVLKVALKYFLLILGPKIFHRPLPYLHVGKVSDLGHP